MSWRNRYEISSDSFLLFEVTGDSELAEDSDINLGNIQDSEDAESCSYDSNDHQQKHNSDQEDNEFNDTDSDDEFDSCEHHWCFQMMVLSKDDEEEEEVESRPAGERNVDILIVEKNIDETEKNKMFWETCLQAGYP